MNLSFCQFFTIIVLFREVHHGVTLNSSENVIEQTILIFHGPINSQSVTVSDMV